jgi:hypothetical protein
MMIQYEDKTKNAHEDMWIYYIINEVNLLHVHVSATFFGHPQVGVIKSIYFKDMKTQCTGVKQ